MTSPFILYVEGESDERILRAWAGQCDALDTIDRVCFKRMEWREQTDHEQDRKRPLRCLEAHCSECSTLGPCFDYDADADWHPAAGNVVTEWKRKNIENYLLVPDAWKRTALRRLGLNQHKTYFLNQHLR